MFSFWKRLLCIGTLFDFHAAQIMVYVGAPMEGFDT